MEVLQYNEISVEKWDQLLAHGSFVSPFQTHSFSKVLDKIFGFDAAVFALSDSGEIKVLLGVALMKEPGPVSFFTWRGIIFGGPVIYNATIEELSFFLTECGNRLKGKAIYLETRNFFDYSFYKDSFLKSGWKYVPYLNVKLNLSGISKDKLTSIFKYNRRREINQSIQNSAKYSLCSGKDELISIYHILQKTYRIKAKLPLPPVEFFLELFKLEIFKAFAVFHEEKTIGGSFCLILPGKSLYTYYYCGLRDYHKRIFPTHLAVLAALEYAVENKIPIIDFMGAGKPGIDYGVRDYKMEFGGDLVEEGRFLKVLSPILYKVGEIGLRVKKALT